MTGAAHAALDYDAYRRQNYFPALDGVRALCVLIVISVHMYDAPTMWAFLAGARGVTVFFILSGYLITLLGLREEESRGKVSLAAFYIRRSCRIFPLYFLTLAVYSVLIFGANLAPHLREQMGRALPYYLFYIQEVPFFAWVAGGWDVPFFHSWSLGVEEKFYLVWPWPAFVLWRGSAGKRGRGTLAVLILLALIPFAPGLTLGGQVLGRWLFSFVAILAGCLLAILLHDRVWFRRLQGLTPWAGWIGAAFLACHFATPWVAGPLLIHGLNILYIATATMMLASIVLGQGALSRLFGSRPLVFVGKLSYGIYLIHVLCMIAVYKVVPPSNGRIALAALAYGLTCALTTVAAWTLALVVERPAIEFGRRWSRKLLASDPPPVQATVAPALG
jgi:peptidoglycan/LPS O-acetylase OafA/YrhL